MDPQVQASSDALERERTAFIAELERHSPQQLIFRPAPNEWSMLEVGQHLQIAQGGWLKQLQRGGVAPVTFGSKARMALIILIFRLGMRARLPKNPAPPTEDLDLETLKSRWDAASEGLITELGMLGPGAFSRPSFRHPISGPISLGQGLEFMRTHISHHRPQLERIRRASGFPTV